MTKQGKYYYYICSRYSGGDSNKHFGYKCSRHEIRRDEIEKIILSKIQGTVKVAKEHTETLAEKFQQYFNKDTQKTLRAKNSEVSKANRRIEELDTIISRIYEDKVTGALSAERFAKMLTGYETEQAKLNANLKTLNAEIED